MQEAPPQKKNRIGLLSLLCALTGLILIHLPGLGLAHIQVPPFPKLTLFSLLEAFFAASLAGALADWYAIAALFRHPLGLRLPHTNIIARRRDLIADAVPRFLLSFIQGETLHAYLLSIDYVALARRGFSQSGAFHTISAQNFRTWLCRWLELEQAYDKGAAKSPELQKLSNLLAKTLLQLLHRWIKAPDLVHGFLSNLAASGKDKVYLGEVLTAIHQWMIKNHNALVEILGPSIRNSAGLFSIFLTDTNISNLVNSLEKSLVEIRNQEDHELRKFILKKIQDWSRKLQEAKSLESEKLHKRWEAFLFTPEFESFVSSFLGQQIQQVLLQAKATDPLQESTTAKLDTWSLWLAYFERQEFRQSLSQFLTQLFVNLATKSKLFEKLSSHIATFIKQSEVAYFVRRVEEAAWNDFQYIRLNGAVVGGLVGFAYACLSALLVSIN